MAGIVSHNAIRRGSMKAFATLALLSAPKHSDVFRQRLDYVFVSVRVTVEVKFCDGNDLSSV